MNNMETLGTMSQHRAVPPVPQYRVCDSERFIPKAQYCDTLLKVATVAVTNPAIAERHL